MDKKGKIITAVIGFIFVSSVVTTGLIFSVLIRWLLNNNNLLTNCIKKFQQM